MLMRVDPAIKTSTSCAANTGTASSIVAAGEPANEAPDWINIIVEIESVGRSEFNAVQSLLVQALIRHLKCEAWPLASYVPHWRAEARVMLDNAVTPYKSILSPSTPAAPKQTATTSNAAPVVLVTLTPLATSAVPRIVRATGQVSARNKASSDSAAWGVSVAAKVTSTAGTLFGPASVGGFSVDNTMTGCAVAATASPAGISITVTGLAGATIAWSSNFPALLEA